MLFSKILPRAAQFRVFSNLSPCSRCNGIFLRDKTNFAGINSESSSKSEGYWEEIRIPVPWGHIAGKAWGNKNGFPVLGLHGWLDNAGTFDTIAPLFLDSMYFVAVDLPGHGFSSHLPPGISYNYVEYLLAIRRIIKYLKWERFSLVGHSLGAGLSALYSGIYPKEVERLVLLDLKKLVSNPMDPTYPKHFRDAFDHFLELEAKTKAEDVPVYGYQEMVTRLVRGTKYQLTEESAKLLMIRGASQVQNMDGWEFTRDLLVTKYDVLIFTHEALFQIHRQIRCPVLLLVAKRGLIKEPEEVLAQCVKIYEENSSNFKVFETGLGHYFYFNEPGEPAKLINNFFQTS